MSTSVGNGISPVLLAIAEKLSAGGNGGVLSPKSTTEFTSSNSVLNAQRPPPGVFALKEGQTIIIVQNYHPDDQGIDGGSTGERSEGESGDPANPGSTVDHGGGDVIWGQPGRPFRMLSGGLHSNGGVTLLVQANDVAMSAASSSPQEGVGGGGHGGGAGDQRHSSGESYEPCPICGDKVSGYHYGIFSCESCKGFFKRTVQNGKSFTCRHKGECAIAITNRKKCPACRFRKCRLAGMRLEAIRPDRTRGGRSNYEGCYARTQPNGSIERVVAPAPTSSQSLPVRRSNSGGVTVPRPSSRALAHSSSTPSLACFNTVPKPDKPSSSSSPSRLSSFMQVLEDLLAAESLVEDEENAEIENQVSLSSNDPFESLFRLIDHCLYKIVRWARNQRDFANIMTDDQIILLQNCWAELLFINCCWKSLKVSDGLHVGKDHVITTEMAKDMDIEKVTQRLLDYTNFLRDYQVDIYEIVALKMLLLLSPDVDNLSDPDVVKAYQEHMLDIFMTYTNEHYPHIPNKFGHLLAKQAELSRTCCVAKELLIPHERSGKVPDKSLLHELLKGDIALH